MNYVLKQEDHNKELTMKKVDLVKFFAGAIVICLYLFNQISALTVIILLIFIAIFVTTGLVVF